MKRIPENLLKLIKKFEGLKFTAYICPAGVATYGYGSTYNYALDRSVQLGDTISSEQSEEFLYREIQEKIIPQAVKIPTWGVLNDNQKNALIDFMYNLGAYFYGHKNFKTITACLKHLKEPITPPQTILNLPKELRELARLPKLTRDGGKYTGEQLMSYALLLYRNPGSSFEEGLVNRRLAEIQLWQSDDNFMKTITSIKDTYLKKLPVQSTELEEDQLVDVELGKEYQIIELLGEEKGHQKVELSHGAGIWYIWPGHWDEWAVMPTEPVEETEEFPKFKEVNWNDFSQKLGPYFTLGEYLQYDNRRIPTAYNTKLNSYKIMYELHKIRKEWGKPLRITSGHRPQAVNRAVGGVSNSRHVAGDAVDIADAQGNTVALETWLDARWAGALGYGARPKGFVHLDMRNAQGFLPQGTKRRGTRWNY